MNKLLILNDYFAEFWAEERKRETEKRQIPGLYKQRDKKSKQRAAKKARKINRRRK